MTALVRIDCTAPASPVVNKTVEILQRRILERCGVAPVQSGQAPCVIRLSIRPGAGPEGFTINSAEPAGVEVVGHDPAGLLYGVGKLLRTSRLEPGRFVPGTWRGTSTPRRSVRGIYFATHFHNFYHAAPLVEVQRYVEDLALWGCNVLSAWFDMRHFRSIDDPAAAGMIHRLRAIFAAAEAVGIRASLTLVPNEAYANSPVEWRAEPTPRTFHYKIELCPDKPAALDQLLRWRKEMLEAFAGVDIRYVWLWPYDSGGCWCEKCRPWGIKGFLKVGRPVAQLVKQCFPQARIVFSTWCFDYHPDSGEWEGLSKAFVQRPEWVDYLMADSHEQFPAHPLQHGVPGGLPMLNFPEISMWNMFPWGGYGANPLPRRFQRIWETVGNRLAGGFPYSEGIFEDMNKVVSLSHYWEDRDALATVREYIAGEFSPDVVEELTPVIEGMEESHGHALAPSVIERLEKPGQASTPLAEGQTLYSLAKPDAAAQRWATVLGVNEKLSPPVRRGWRWRLIYLRAALDDELTRSGGAATAASEKYFEELGRLYHAQRAEAAVSPPSVAALQRLTAPVTQAPSSAIPLT